MNLSNKNLRAQMLQFCGSLGQDDGLNPREDPPIHCQGELSRNYRQQRLCRQIANTLSLALEDAPDPLVAEFRLLIVQPRRSNKSVTVCVETMDDTNRGQLMERLKNLEGWFRREIAAAISRKRVPRIVFEIRIQNDHCGRPQ